MTDDSAAPRLFVLTDIAGGLENDDIQSLARLLLYANVIDVEGIVAVTSCWQRRAARVRNARLIHRVIDAYEHARSNLEAHEGGFPSADALRKVTALGIPAYGRAPGDGFAETRWNDVPGVRALVSAADRDDPRPLWVALWGGANTLAQALWTAERELDDARFAALLARLRVHAISDQDAAGYWIRQRYGDRILTIVSPSTIGGKLYRHATWPGLSADRFGHGSEDGVQGGGFAGADASLVTRQWVKDVVRRTGAYGRRYPVHRFIMEGDTPSYLGLIPNGLNVPEQPGAGGWGGRYAHYVPDMAYTGTNERHPIWTNASDTVIGHDGAPHTSPQATIWRWRTDIQNDFVNRLRWAGSADRSIADHPPVVTLAHPDRVDVVTGAEVTLDASPSRDSDGRGLRFEWIPYPEIGMAPHVTAVELRDATSARCSFIAPAVRNAASFVFIVAARTVGAEPIARYRRVTVTVSPAAG
ncbi:nucleoside hydrolase-like domain-containing protein [Microbacterium fluvii]|uniref:Nucleoside hydrolase-like domain-containing protein n=1 Tax=Microbacterium fluvii TaxID=415215 RepID=A0ABW2HE49_9MICO|nr:DUF1593 domain-containing protein [Microbacterium fluvii]MCU4673040.1 DUF1593 domain-containing protein [Microbacterium fluvii]